MRAPARTHLTPRARAAFGLGGAWLVAHELHVLLAPGLGGGPLFSRYAHDALLLAAAALCLAGGLRHRGAERVGWLLVGSGVLAWSLGELHYTAVLWEDPSPPIPSPADIGYLLFPPLALAGGVVLLRSRAHGVPRRRWLDGFIAALSIAALSAAIVFQTVLDDVAGDTLAVATALAYPLFDLVLLALFVGALAGTGWRLDRTWMLLALGISTFWLADSLYLVRTAQGTYESGGWFDAGWWAGLMLVALAAWQRDSPPDTRPADERLRAIALPLGFGVVGLGLLVYAGIASVNPLAVALAAASALAVMGRTVVVFVDNVAMLRASRDEALTDALTGLGNRRALTRALDVRIDALTSERSTSTASSSTTTPSGTRRAMPCSCASATAWPPSWTAAAMSSAWVATSSARCSPPATRARRRSWRAPAAPCPSTARDSR